MAKEIPMGVWIEPLPGQIQIPPPKKKGTAAGGAIVAIKLTKKIKTAIEELGAGSLKMPFYWKWSEKAFSSRTVVSGYALYIQTGSHDNGTIIERRLWVNPDIRYAMDIAKEIDRVTGDRNQLHRLEKLIIEIEADWKRRER